MQIPDCTCLYIPSKLSLSLLTPYVTNVTLVWSLWEANIYKHQRLWHQWLQMCILPLNYGNLSFWHPVHNRLTTLERKYVVRVQVRFWCIEKQRPDLTKDLHGYEGNIYICRISHTWRGLRRAVTFPLYLLRPTSLGCRGTSRLHRTPN